MRPLERLLQPGHDIAALAAVRFQIARPFEIGDQRRVDFERLHQLVARLEKVLGEAQPPPQLGDLRNVVPQDRFLVQANGVAGHIVRDVGVAVPVSADPRAESQEGGDGARPLVVAGQGPLEAAINLRHDLEEGVADHPQAVTDFILHGGAVVADDVGEPERFDLGGDGVERLLAFARHEPHIFEPVELLCDRVEFFQHSSPAGFTRMGRKYGKHERASQNASDLIRRDAAVFERGQCGFRGVGKRLDRRIFRPPAERADAGPLLSQVDQVEIQAEGTGQRPQLGKIHRGQSVAELAGRFERRGQAQLLRRGADLFDQTQ